MTIDAINVPTTTTARRRSPKPSFAKAIRQAEKAGVKVATATIAQDGTITLSFTQGAGEKHVGQHA